MNRRGFLRGAAGAGLVVGAGLPSLGRRLAAAGAGPNLSHVEARYYVKLPDREIECRLCPRLCRLGDKERGYCGVRENDGGTYYTLVYGKVCSLNVDPIEKKPFFHVLPGTTAFSLATAGCNVNCKFCQNWEISQVRPEQVEAYRPRPRSRRRPGRRGRAVPRSPTPTPSRPSSTSTCTTRPSGPSGRGVRNVVVTGGHINPEPLADLLAVVDAVKVDLKGFSEKFYAEYVRGDLKPVLETIRAVAKSKAWLEIVDLVIPTLNDRMDQIREMAAGSGTRPATASRSISPDSSRCTSSRTCPRPPSRRSKPRGESPSRRACASSTWATSPATRARTRTVPAAARPVIARTGLQRRDRPAQEGQVRDMRDADPRHLDLKPWAAALPPGLSGRRLSDLSPQGIRGRILRQRAHLRPLPRVLASLGRAGQPRQAPERPGAGKRDWPGSTAWPSFSSLPGSSR